MALGNACLYTLPKGLPLWVRAAWCRSPYMGAPSLGRLNRARNRGSSSGMAFGNSFHYARELLTFSSLSNSAKGWSSSIC